jgi:hypothetical protein
MEVYKVATGRQGTSTYNAPLSTHAYRPVDT